MLVKATYVADNHIKVQKEERTMKYRRINSSNLAVLAEHVADLLAGTDLEAIDAGVRAELLAALGTLPATLAQQTASAAVVESERRSIIGARNVSAAEICKVLSRVRDALKAGDAPDDQFALCGFDYGQPRIKAYIADDPTDLTAVGYSNGVNKIRYNGNNRYGLVMYEIWRRDSNTGVWRTHSLNTRQTFIDSPVVPGQFYQYRVRAVAAQTISHYSNTAVVYGAM